MYAETAYLFRHALVRDAAYELQVPSERSVLHRLALQLIEDLYGGRPSTNIEAINPALALPDRLAIDPVAEELAEHARLGRLQEESGETRDVEAVYLLHAALHADRTFDRERAIRIWDRLAAVGPIQLKAHALNMTCPRFMYRLL